MKTSLILFGLGLLVFLTSCKGEVEGDEAGECDDGVDNDQNGIVDCNDPGCVVATSCAKSQSLDAYVLGMVASSAVAHLDDLSFLPSVLHDGNLSTCWQEANKESAGTGETITVFFDRPVDLTGIRVANGCQIKSKKYGDLYSKNSRPKGLRLHSEGGFSPILSLSDSQGWQNLSVDLPGVESVTLEVESVYRGSRWQDASMSELEFWGRPSRSQARQLALDPGTHCYRGPKLTEEWLTDLGFSASEELYTEVLVKIEGKTVGVQVSDPTDELNGGDSFYGFLTASRLTGMTQANLCGPGADRVPFYTFDFKVTDREFHGWGKEVLKRVRCKGATGPSGLKNYFSD